jgi:hypothetical protein
MRPLSPRSVRLALVVCLGLVGLTACSSGQQQPLSLTERDSIAACRLQANQIYDRQNRGAIYSVDSNWAPSSSVGLGPLPTSGLSDQFAHEQRIDRCIRDTGAGSNAPVGSGPTTTPITGPTPVAPRP